MIVFIDDSGDPGFKTEKGASKFFVVAAVIFEDTLEIEKCAVAIKELRRKIFKSDYEEFKFSKSKHSVRERFLKTIAQFDFKICAIVIEKEILYSHTLRTNQSKFYSYVIKKLIEGNKQYLHEANIKIDGHGNKKFRREFNAYIKRELGTTVKTSKLVDSKNNVMIQMADMIAGTIRRAHARKDKSSKGLHKILRKHILNEWLFQ